VIDKAAGAAAVLRRCGDGGCAASRGAFSLRVSSSTSALTGARFRLACASVGVWAAGGGAKRRGATLPSGGGIGGLYRPLPLLHVCGRCLPWQARHEEPSDAGAPKGLTPSRTAKWPPADKPTITCVLRCPVVVPPLDVGEFITFRQCSMTASPLRLLPSRSATAGQCLERFDSVPSRPLSQPSAAALAANSATSARSASSSSRVQRVQRVLALDSGSEGFATPPACTVSSL
jgi:hypothetical protein